MSMAGPSLLKSRRQMTAQVHAELRLLRAPRNWAVILFGMLWQYVHSVATNLVYYLETEMSPCQRQPLYDLGFVLLPELPSQFKIGSEVLFNSVWFVGVGCLISPLFWRGRAPHGRRGYVVLALRRVMVSLVFLQTLRIMSFSVTLLPGAARQCTPGSKYWDPPLTMKEVFFRVDAVHGCGDLMFSSHTIFTMTILMHIFTYYNWTLIKAIILTIQVTMVPLIISARKHYTLDILTALYVVPLWWLMYEARYPDPTEDELRSRYKIDPDDDLLENESKRMTSKTSASDLMQLVIQDSSDHEHRRRHQFHRSFSANASSNSGSSSSFTSSPSPISSSSSGTGAEAHRPSPMSSTPGSHHQRHYNLPHQQPQNRCSNNATINNSNSSTSSVWNMILSPIVALAGSASDPSSSPASTPASDAGGLVRRPSGDDAV